MRVNRRSHQGGSLHPQPTGPAVARMHSHARRCAHAQVHTSARAKRRTRENSQLRSGRTKRNKASCAYAQERNCVRLFLGAFSAVITSPIARLVGSFFRVLPVAWGKIWTRRRSAHSASRLPSTGAPPSRTQCSQAEGEEK